MPSLIVENDDDGYLWAIAYSVQCSGCGTTRSIAAGTLAAAKRTQKVISFQAGHQKTCIYHPNNRKGNMP